MKLAPIAAVLVACASAWAQSECCNSKKAEAVVQTVSAETTSCQKACESGATTQTVAVEACSDECAEYCESACESGAVVQTVALQDEACSEECAEYCEEACASACQDKGAVQTVAMPSDMPVMMYVVGDKQTRCSAEAGKMASACDSMTVGYQVAGKTYHCQQSAGKAYAAALHNYVDNFTRVTFVVDGNCTACPFEASSMCDKTDKKMQYKVGNTVFDCADKAVRAAAMAHYSVQQVKLGHAVNGKATSCSTSFESAKACPTSKATYLVGQKQTECAIEASCMLEMARVEAAIAACQMVASQG